MDLLQRGNVQWVEAVADSVSRTQLLERAAHVVQLLPRLQQRHVPLVLLHASPSAPRRKVRTGSEVEDRAWEFPCLCGGPCTVDPGSVPLQIWVKKVCFTLLASGRAGAHQKVKGFRLLESGLELWNET